MSRNPPSQSPNTKTQNYTFSLYPSDDELIAWIQERLGGSRSDAVRSSLRAFATHLALITNTRA